MWDDRAQQRGRKSKDESELLGSFGGLRACGEMGEGKVIMAHAPYCA